MKLVPRTTFLKKEAPIANSECRLFVFGFQTRLDTERKRDQANQKSRQASCAGMKPLRLPKIMRQVR